MTYETYKERYVAAYNKQLNMINIVDPMYDDEVLHECFEMYNNHAYPYFRAFKPALVAQSNVMFFDYQVTNALDQYGYDWHIDTKWMDRDEIMDLCRNHREQMIESIKHYYHND